MEKYLNDLFEDGQQARVVDTNTSPQHWQKRPHLVITVKHSLQTKRNTAGTKILQATWHRSKRWHYTYLLLSTFMS